jgi:hypothetical protein
MGSLMPDKLVPVASYETPFEAHAARGVLAAQGIAAQVADENVAGALFHVGTALGGVKLLVWQADLARAQAALFGGEADDESERARPHDRWKCAKCREWNEPAFDYCWSCGADYVVGEQVTEEESNEIAEDAPAPGAPSMLATFADGSRSEPATLPPLSPEEAANPYAPGRLPAQTVVETKVETEVESDPEVERMITRAWRAAVIGLVFCPVILHFYSLWILVGAAGSFSNFSHESRRWFYAAIVLDVFVLFVVGLTLWIAFLGGTQ